MSGKPNFKGFDVTNIALHKVHTHIFKKEDRKWYIHLPHYLEQGWSKSDLEMGSGAHKILNGVTNGEKKVTLRLSTVPFDGADILQLIDYSEDPVGGAFYLVDTLYGKAIHAFIELSDLTLFVFGDIPKRIYLQRVVRKRPPIKKFEAG